MSLTYHRLKVVVLCVFIGIGTTGCASKIKATNSGFLSNYDNMIQDPDQETMSVSDNVTKDLGNYSKFMIAPVQIYLADNAEHKTIDPEEAKKLTDYFDEKLREGLSENYTVVDSQGEGVLLVRAAITDVLPNKIYLNLHWSTTLLGGGIGGASLEAELIDSGDGERVFAVIDGRKGKRLKYTKGLSKWGHTKGVIDDWSKMIVKTIDEAHGNTE